MLTNKKIKFYYCLLGLIICLSNCTPRFPNYPASKTCDFSISEPLGECYTNYSKTGRKIKFIISIMTKIEVSSALGTRTELFDDSTITVEPIVGPGSIFPVHLPVDIPASGPCQVEIYIQGAECSTCANNESVSNEVPYGNCPSATLNTNPATYRAALPRWQGTLPIQDCRNVNGQNLSGVPRIPNVPFSCGCTVPY